MKPIPRVGLWLALLCAACGGVAEAATGELPLRAQLIWGTDGPRPKEPKLKDVEQPILEKLKGVFKWKNYYEVDRQEFKVGVAAKKRVRMSPKCEVEVHNLGASTVEVDLYGEGKLVVRKKQVIKSGELLVLAGDDKNDTAWFVIMSLVVSR